jgi:hypothetical protein
MMAPMNDIECMREAIREAAPDDREAYNRALNGSGPLSELGISIPEDYQAYLDLGRFRNAIVLHEEKRHHHPNLARFIAQNGLNTIALEHVLTIPPNQHPAQAPAPISSGNISRSTTMLHMSPRIPVR